MPIFRIDDKLYFFAHVPKCAGTTIERYLIRQFGELALLNPSHRIDQNGKAVPFAMRWSRSSPQHILVEDLKRIIPLEWITESFAIVRHPINRFVSAYQQLLARGYIPRNMTPDELLDEFLSLRQAFPYLYDNHLRAQSEFIPSGSKVFKLEDGLGHVVDYISEISRSPRGDSTIEVANKGVSGTARHMVWHELSPKLHERLTKVFADDFRNFEYDAIDPMPVHFAMPRLSSAKSLLHSISKARRRTRRVAALASGGLVSWQNE